jgi:hypothetical protein
MANAARQGPVNGWKKVGVILLTVAFVIAPLGSLVLVFEGVRRLSAHRRGETSPDAYTEWLALRSIARSHMVDGLSRASRRA